MDYITNINNNIWIEIFNFASLKRKLKEMTKITVEKGF